METACDDADETVLTEHIFMTVAMLAEYSELQEAYKSFPHGFILFLHPDEAVRNEAVRQAKTEFTLMTRLEAQVSDFDIRPHSVLCQQPQNHAMN
jgi:hypothetical protein